MNRKRKRNYGYVILFLGLWFFCSECECITNAFSICSDDHLFEGQLEILTGKEEKYKSDKRKEKIKKM